MRKPMHREVIQSHTAVNHGGAGILTQVVWLPGSSS